MLHRAGHFQVDCPFSVENTCRSHIFGSVNGHFKNIRFDNKWDIGSLQITFHIKTKNMFFNSITTIFVILPCSDFPLMVCFFLFFFQIDSAQLLMPPDVTLVFSRSSPCHDHGDHSRWPSASWFNHIFLHHHHHSSSTCTCTPLGEVHVCVSALSKHCLTCSQAHSIESFVNRTKTSKF